jgi:hypothetical protein
MPNYINFIKKQADLLKKTSKKLFIIRVASLSLIFIYGILLFSVVSLQVIFKTRNAALNKKIDEKKEQVEKHHAKETKYFVMANKINALVNLLPGREKKQKIVHSFFELMTDEVKLTGFEIAEKGRVNFSGSCSTLGQMEEQLNKIKTEASLSKLPVLQAKVLNINYGSNEGYRFNAYIIFAEK